MHAATSLQAEPFSQAIERSAQASPTFRSACTRLARWQSNLQYNRDLRRLAHEQKISELRPEPGRAASVPADDYSSLEPPAELSEREATAKGADLLGEGIVIAVGLGLLAHQYNSERQDEAAQQETIDANERRIRELEGEQMALRVRLAALETRPQQPPSSWWRLFGR